MKQFQKFIFALLLGILCIIQSISSVTVSAHVKADAVEQLLQQMTLQEKVYQMFIVTPEALTQTSGYLTAFPASAKTAIAQTPVGGVIYFAGNLSTQSQTRTMLQTIQTYARNNNGIGLFQAVDEEGGTVARAAQKLGTTAFSSMQYYGSLGNTETVRNIGATIGSDLKGLGFNVDFAPVADVNINSGNELGNRIFSSDAGVVSSMTAAFVNGMQPKGVSATLKHFPGLGAGNGNTHNDSVVIVRSYAQLQKQEFVAFQGGIAANADFVMVGHQVTTASGDGLPGDLSSVVVTDWLKTKLGFSGLAVTDSQSMGAIINHYTPGEAAVKSVQAGMDCILMPYNLKQAADGILNAVEKGTISEERIQESVRKILTKKMEKGLLTATEQLLPGDWDDNQKLDVNDAVAVLRVYARRCAELPLEATARELLAGDYNQDDMLDVADAVEILRIYAAESAGSM